MIDESRLLFIREAQHLAEKAALAGDVPVGAVVVHQGNVIGRGWNAREARQDPTAHAEILALREASTSLGTWHLDGCEIYVTLEPCPMCAGALVLSRIARCLYGCSDPKGGFLGTLQDLSQFPGLNHKFEVVRGLDEEACSAQLTGFFRELRAKRRAERRRSTMISIP